MKKILYFSIALSVLFAVSCNKNENILPEEIAVEQVSKTFNVTMADTKTTINSLDSEKVLWSASDKINIIGVTAGGAKTNHEFSIASGQGTGSATFTGTVNADEISFYALYPYKAVSWDSDVMVSENINPTQTAVAGSFDPAAAEMIAVADANDNLVFSHGRAYIKFTMGSENVTAVTFTSSNCNLTAKNKYNMPACTINSTGGSQAKTVTLAGTFVLGNTYYVAIPLHSKQMKNLSVQFTFAGGGASVTKTTAALSSIIPSENAGKVFNIGTIALEALAPSITATNVSINADATGGTIDFTVLNPVSDGTASYTVTDGLSNAVWKTISYDNNTGVGSVEFECNANTDTSAPKTATIHLTYTYDTDKTATKDVTVTQKKAGAIVENYVWNFSTDEWQDAMNTQAPGAKDTKASGWSVSYDNLSYYAGSDDRWSVNGYIQPNGSGYYKTSSKRRYFLFTTTGGGYVYVTVGSNASSNKTADVCAQLGEKDSPDFSESVTSTASSTTTVELGPFTTGGDIAVFLGGSGHRIYKIEFHTNAL